MDDQFTIGREGSNNVDGGTQSIEASIRTYPLLFEMLRSFTTLASTLNLSHAMRDLGSTRQTVRRHIAQLEEIKGGQLFEVSERQYALTDLGRKVLAEAQDLLARAEGWVNGSSSRIDGLQYLRHIEKDGWLFYQQQHPIGKAFTSTGDMIPGCLAAWGEAGGDIEHPAMKEIRPLCTIFRRADGSWLFTEVGDESSFVSWFGWTTARSTIGRALGQLPGGDGFGRLVNEAFHEVETNQSVRLDHVFTIIEHEESGKDLPICYERLLLGSRFADGTFAMVSAVRRTYDIEIMGVSEEMLRGMPEDLLM